jgi:hypothetical protein
MNAKKKDIIDKLNRIKRESGIKKGIMILVSFI